MSRLFDINIDKEKDLVGVNFHFGKQINMVNHEVPGFSFDELLVSLDM